MGVKTLIGQTLGQYQIVEQIGKGGMATVFKAYQPGLDRYVAIKVLPAYYAHEEGFSERFVREAKAIARLDHPNILPVYDFGQTDGLSYIVMKHVAAGTLKARLGNPMMPEAALEILRQIAAALDHAHDQGILHRDVKPGNILIDEKGWVYLSDFGLAKMVEGSVQLTGSGVGVGTPAYMSPEQGQGLAVDGSTDVYSLGVVLYEMLTGRVPFEAETPMAVVVKHITSPLPLPRSINPTISESVERVVLKALAKDPDDRFPRAGDLVDAIETAITPTEREEFIPSSLPAASTPGTVQPVPPAPAYPAYAPPPPIAPSPPLQSAVPPKRSSLPMLVVVGGASVVLIIGFVLVVASILLLGRNRKTVSSAMASPSAPIATPPLATLESSTSQMTDDTPTPRPIPTDTAMLLPTFTSVLTEAPSPTFTTGPTNTLIATSTSAPTDTPVPPTFTPTRPTTPDTGHRPHPLFNGMWEELGGGSSPLGYPTGRAITDRNYAKQYFERGFMYWWQSPTSPQPIWTVVIPDPTADSGTTWMHYDNAWDPSASLFPPNCPEATEPLGPMAGFGVTWCDRPGVKEQVGAPLEREFGSGDTYPKGAVQFFQHGVMFENPSDRQIWALVEDYGWRRAGY